MSNKLSNSEVLTRLTQLYGNLYDLSMVNYTGCNNKIILVCSVHGQFSRMAQKELTGPGCPKCNMANIGKHRSYNKLKTTSEFISDAIKKHGNTYDYSLVKYKNTDTKVQIICPSHGVFKQLPWGHLKYGCRQCGVHKSRIEKEWLGSLNVPTLITQYRIPIRNYTVDGYDPITNTVYEFYGDYWHGNPIKFASANINTRTPKQKTFGRLYRDTLKREVILKDLGYNVVSIWESEFKSSC